MKILWFEISIPAAYSSSKLPVMGWQDSLEEMVKGREDIELTISFEAPMGSVPKTINGIKYIPICTHYNWLERQRMSYSYDVIIDKIIPKCVDVVNAIRPDVIHVFGNEWPFGLVAEYVDVPVIIHIQGSIIPYNNALYPPKYNHFDMIRTAGLNIRKQFRLWKDEHKNESRKLMEERTWKAVKYYMGRTSWDYALSKILSPESMYFHVEEALRPFILNYGQKWRGYDGGKVKLVTTGMWNFWKGPDMLLKTAKILLESNVDFEWKVAGGIEPQIKKTVERKEQCSFADCNVEILGFQNPESLCELLCNSTMYVHTAYIENSPNSICEAQLLGLPIVSTNVGGISSLVKYGEEGLLVPANDPWQMAYAIISLAENYNEMRKYSDNNVLRARERHSKENIFNQLMEAYKMVLK